MTDQDRAQETAGADGVGERDELVYALEGRFAPHVGAAASLVRDAERGLAEANERLAAARQAAEEERYRSDPLVFMRSTLQEEVEGLDRKTTPKKVRNAYRFLLDRAVELAAGEVQGFHDDAEAERAEREDGVQASLAAQERAEATLEAARAAQERVASAERAARRGLDLMLAKLSGPPEG
ncbi:hypothetical protein [Ornithinimicrobium avium]|uniref:Uncharacterized protein n=1 Tax=Ornithinimicrobium avium TaxID=2283195 RepID=A0A345NNV3_9MICO|nr:hypothetical protein [Ornithinimicrobium avium]AXH96711.1 hypothetical protein DV701_11815 [Ornithinimicrobium avium]